MKTKIEIIEPRSLVEVHLPDGQVLSGPRGSTVGEFLLMVKNKLPAPAVGAITNGELRELNYPVVIESKLSAVTMADADGARIYSRSLTFMLEVALSAHFTEGWLLIDH